MADEPKKVVCIEDELEMIELVKLILGAVTSLMLPALLAAMKGSPKLAKFSQTSFCLIS
jgi:hypothetical protein